MLGKRSSQGKIYDPWTQLSPEAIAGLGFHGKVATEGRNHFHDQDFASMYAEGGRPSVPPSTLALARLLQVHDRISDAEVVERCRYDARWKAALDLDLISMKAPFVKSTFQAFRVRLTVHEKEGLAFERSVRAAREAGLLPHKLKVALDSTPVRGRGAVKDTFNLLSDAIVSVVRAVASKQGRQPKKVAREAGVKRHLDAPSIKGTEVVDWGDREAVSSFLAGLLSDCARVVAIAEKAECATDEAALLKKVIADDVQQEPGKPPRIRKGVAKSRTVSVHDPQMRHGRKSSGKVYNGHKAHTAVEIGSGVITAVGVTGPDGPDGGQVKDLVDQTKRTTGLPVTHAIGDAAYSTRPALAQAKKARVDLRTKMPSTSRCGLYGASDFTVSKDRKIAKCPAGVRSARTRKTPEGITHFFPPATCRSCALRAQCTKAKNRPQRTLLVPRDFHQRRQRERYARSAKGRQFLRQRMAVEHGIGRMKNLGAGVSRYFGRLKTRGQFSWIAAVANFSLVWERQKADAMA